MWRTALMQTLIYSCRQSLCSLAALFGFGLACGVTSAAEGQSMSADAPDAHDTSELETTNGSHGGGRDRVPVVNETYSRETHRPVAAETRSDPIRDTEPVADSVLPHSQLPVPLAATGFAFSTLSVAAGVSLSWLALFVATLMILRPR